MVDESGVILMVNTQIERLFGYSREELIGRPIETLIPERFRPQHPSHRKQFYTAPSVRVLGSGRDLFGLRKDGTEVAVEIGLTPIETVQGARVLASVVDITERKRTEEALRASEERLAYALDATTEGIWDWNIQTGEVYFSPRWIASLGYTPDEVPPRVSFWESIVHPEDMPRVREALSAHWEKRTPIYECENRLLTKSGVWRNNLDRGRVVEWDAAGKPLRMVGTDTDITERRQLEEQLRHAQMMETVGQLAGGIAHDFNNLLTALLGSCGFLRGGLPPGDPLIEEVDEIQKAGTRAATLTRHLLAFSRKQILQPQVLDLNDVVAGMEGTLRRLIREDIALTVTLGSALWRVKVDPSQIEQAVLNLVLNACDAMPQGGRIAITTTNLAVTEATDIGKSLLPPGSYATLTVSDSGGGMDAKTLAHLFEPFFTTKEIGKGTGLGLAMVHGVITQSGGHVGVANESGRRAAFTIYLPRVEEPLESPQPDVARAEPPQGAGAIVVVEDEEMIRTVACRVLERCGYRVLSAAYSDEALLLAGRYEGGIALLITDVVLPGMNGRELAERLRSVHPAMKVLYMSGYTDDVAVQHGVLSARLPFLQKPFTPDDLMRKVREVLEGGGG